MVSSWSVYRLDLVCKAGMVRSHPAAWRGERAAQPLLSHGVEGVERDVDHHYSRCRGRKIWLEGEEVMGQAQPCCPGLGYLAAGLGGSINCHCSPATRFCNPEAMVYSHSHFQTNFCEYICPSKLPDAIILGTKMPAFHLTQQKPSGNVLIQNNSLRDSP